MKIILEKKKGEVIKENILFNFLEWKFYIFAAALIFGIWCMISGKEYGIAFFAPGFVYLVLRLHRIISIAKNVKGKLRLEYILHNNKFQLKDESSAIDIEYDNIVKIKENKIFYILFVKKSNNNPLRYIQIYKNGIVEGNLQNFITELKNKIKVKNQVVNDLNNDSNTEINKSKKEKEILVFKSSWKHDLRRRQAQYYSRFSTIALVIASALLGIILLNSENSTYAGILLLSMTVLIILSPFIEILQKRSGAVVTIRQEEKDSLIFSIHKTDYSMKIDKLRITKNKNGEVILGSIENRNITFGIMQSEIINGDIDKLFEIIKPGYTLENSPLGLISFLMAATAIIQVPLILFWQKIGMEKFIVPIIVILILISLVISIINLCKKGVRKRFAKMAMIIDILMISFFMVIVLNIM